jgi:hypothetical protein
MKKLSILTALMLLFSFAGFSQDEDKVDSSPAGILEYLKELRVAIAGSIKSNQVRASILYRKGTVCLLFLVI